MTSQRDIKTTWELAGRLAGSFETSTQKAQSRLAQLRQEYRANQSELRNMQTVMRTAERGTVAYANASRRIPELQQSISQQAFEIGDLQREILGGAQAQGQMETATARASTAMRGLVTYGLAAGGAIGIAAGTVTALAAALNESSREAQSLQTLSIRGIDPTAYQEASNSMRILTGDAEAAQRAVAGIAQSGQETREALAFDPRRLGVDFRRGVSELGFDSPQQFAEATANADTYFAHLRDLVEQAQGDQMRLDRLRAAVGAVGQDRLLIDAAVEYNDLVQQAADARRRANAGDQAAAQELLALEERMARIRTTAGVLTEEQQALLVQYSETVEGLKLAGRDMKIAFTTSFADDMIAGAEHLTRFITQASDLWDRLNRPDERTPEERNPGLRDWADLVLTGGSGWISGSPLGSRGGMRLGDFGREASDTLVSYGRTADQLANDVGRLIDWSLNFQLPGFAQGGIVPGPRGRGQLAMVHGGERVLSIRERELLERAVAGATQGATSSAHYDQRQERRVIEQHNTFEISGSIAGGMDVGEDIAAVLARQLATGIAW